MFALQLTLIPTLTHALILALPLIRPRTRTVALTLTDEHVHFHLLKRLYLH